MYPYRPPKKGATNNGICDRLTNAEDALKPMVYMNAVWFSLRATSSRFFLSAPFLANSARFCNSAFTSSNAAVRFLALLPTKLLASGTATC